MQELSDNELLVKYVERASEEAFALLTERHINKVYSVALRHVRNSHEAEEITQAVFIILAKKSPSLLKHACFSGWLYQTARLTSVTFLRSEMRRAHREQEAYMQSSLDQTESEAWQRMAPLLDDAIASLSSKERDAVVLRFFDGKSMKEIGVALDLKEDAAKKRVNRGLEKIRNFFTRRGVASTTTLLAAVITTHSAQAAPAGLAKTIASVAIVKGSAAGGSTLSLVKGALKIMAWTKAKMAVVAGVGVLLTAGTATVTIKEIQNHQTYSWQVLDPKDVNLLMKTTPPQITLVPTKFPRDGGFTYLGENGKAMGINCSTLDVLRIAFSRDSGFLPTHRVLFETNLPDQGYDFIANINFGSRAGLQLKIEKKLGLIGKYETRMADVLALKEGTNQAGLRAGQILKGEVTIGEGGFGMGRQTSLSELAQGLDHRMNLPVVDQTSLTNHFDLIMSWSTMAAGFDEELKKLLHNQLGLDLVPSREPTEMLVVKKVE